MSSSAGAGAAFPSRRVVRPWPAAALVSLTVLAALIATVLLRAAPGGGANVGWVWVCGRHNVPAPTLGGLVTTWAVEPLAVVALVWLAIGYLAVYRHPRVARRRERKRLVAFMTGNALIAMTAFGPLCAFDNTFLTAHMVQHFLLITLAPPLLLAGAPMTYLLVALGRDGRARWVYPVTHSRPFIFATNPIIGVALFLIVPATWYVTPLFALSLRYDLLHWAGYAIFLFAGVHYWWPVIGRNPTHWNLAHPVQVAYLFALTPIHALLGTLFYSPDRVLYPQLATVARDWGPSPLLDQQFAGMLMLVAGEIIGLVSMIVAANRWANADQREARRFDRSRGRRAATGDSAGGLTP